MRNLNPNAVPLVDRPVSEKNLSSVGNFFGLYGGEHIAATGVCYRRNAGSMGLLCEIHHSGSNHRQHSGNAVLHLLLCYIGHQHAPDPVQLSEKDPRSARTEGL